MAKRPNRKVSHISNDYTKKKKIQAVRKRKRRNRLFRRLFIGAVVMTMIVSLFGWEYYQKNKRFNELAAEKEELQVQLKEVQSYQKDLQDELKRLEDDEYIEKLARQKYLVGKSGETIFSIPEEEEEEKEKDEEDENEKK